jgi:hypothetical protein
MLVDTPININVGSKNNVTIMVTLFFGVVLDFFNV